MQCLVAVFRVSSSVHRLLPPKLAFRSFFYVCVWVLLMFPIIFPHRVAHLDSFAVPAIPTYSYVHRPLLFLSIVSPLCVSCSRWVYMYH